MTPTSLSSFLEFLNGLDRAAFKTDAIDEYFNRFQVNPDDFLPFMFFREDTYARNLVAKNENYELIVLTWLPHQRTRIHTHAEQRCWMAVTVGSLSVKNYAPPVTDTCELKSLGAPEIVCEGNSVYVDDGLAAHSIVNHTLKPAVSVHLYAGPIPSCKIYNECTRKFERIELCYFTEYGVPIPASMKPTSAQTEL